MVRLIFLPFLLQGKGNWRFSNRWFLTLFSMFPTLSSLGCFGEEPHHRDDTLTDINLCTLPPNMPFNGYEFVKQGVSISPLSNDHILYTKGGQTDSCFCSGSCSYNHLDPLQECDFHGGIQLDFFEPMDYVSVDIISPFSNVVLTAFTTQGETFTEHVLKGNVFPQSLAIEALDITKVELKGSSGAWCMHKQLRFSKQESPKKQENLLHGTDTPTLSPTDLDHHYQHVPVSIKPRICPKILWMINDQGPSNGIFPVAILGTDEFNAESIDIASVALMGPSGYHPVYPTHYKLVDISSPSFHEEQCDCSLDSMLDGYIDIIFYFEKKDIIAIPEISYANDGDEIVLTIKGVGDKIDHKKYSILEKKETLTNSINRGRPLTSNDVEDFVSGNGNRELQGEKLQDERDGTLDDDRLSRINMNEKESTNTYFDDDRLYVGSIQIERNNGDDEVINDPRLNPLQSDDAMDDDSHDANHSHPIPQEDDMDDLFTSSYTTLSRPSVLRRLETWIGTTIHQVSWWSYKDGRFSDTKDLKQTSEIDSIASNTGTDHQYELTDAGAALQHHEVEGEHHYSGGTSTDEPVYLDDDQLVNYTDDLDFLYGDGGIQASGVDTYSYEEHGGNVWFYGEDCIIVMKGNS